MGKRYYCEYCDKSMVATTETIRTHNAGMQHNRARSDHYHAFKDTRTILREESAKMPCKRHTAEVECPFGSLCRYSHYSQEHLQLLRQQVEMEDYQTAVGEEPSLQTFYDRLQENRTLQVQKEPDTDILRGPDGQVVVCPWKYPESLARWDERVLPPSTRKFKIEDFHNVEFSEWG